MKTNEKWENDLMKSINEQDVMQLRNKLHEIRIFTENQLQSYSMNRTDDVDYTR